MNKHLKSYYSRFINNGIESSDDFSFRKKTHIINAIVGLMAPVIFIFIFQSMIVYNPLKLIMLVVSLGSIALAFYLNGRRKNNMALGLLYGYTFFYVIFIVLTNTKQGPSHFLMIPMAGSMFYLIPNRVLRAVMYSLAILVFLLLNYYQAKYLPFSDWAYFVSALYFVILFFGLGLFETDHTNYQKIVEKKNEKLQKQYEKIEQQTAELEELNAAKSTFITNVSHELRTPLTILLGIVNQVAASEKSNNKHLLSIAEKNGKILNQLVNQLLDVSKLESGEMTLTVNQHDIVAELRDLVTSFSVLASEKEIEIVVSTNIDQLSFHLDRDKITKIFYNLIYNAIKFTPTGGQISININRNNQGIVIEVADTGKGIAKDKLSYIFDRFYQINPDDVNPGTGIGLSLVKELVKLHNGHIEVMSKLGTGTTFTVWLPITEQDSFELGDEDALTNTEIVNTPEARHTTLETESSEKSTVLVIEDNDDMRYFIAQGLESYFNIITASNGQKGIETAREQMPDVIISDVMMPEKNGLELCQDLKSDQLTSHIPIILLTAKATDEDKHKGLVQGADDYIIKPFDIIALSLKVGNLIATQRRLAERLSLIQNHSVITPETNNTDKVFLEKVYSVAEEHFVNSKFSIEDFAKEVNMSSTQLNRKLKALMNTSINKLLVNQRLKKATDMLVTSDHQVSEIAYQVGFSSPAYFIKTFKDAYDETPNKYRSRKVGA